VQFPCPGKETGGAPQTGLEQSDGEDRLVRPFFVTRGRTRSNLPIEAMVVATGTPPLRPMSREYVEALRACRFPRAVAEVAGMTRLPLGVTRVLLEDLVRAGLIRAGAVATLSGTTAPPDLALLDRLIAGIQRMD
jgi:hypothetical protein